MAKVEIKAGSTILADGLLQLQNGVPMDGTLRSVADQSNTTSPLKLSTGLVSVASTLQIATNDTQYLDAEDTGGNNRFTISRNAGSQVVNVDFASNPTAGTDQVGAIRTYQDGVSLSDSISFRRNGYVGINTSSPFAPLTVGSNSSFYSVQSAGTGSDFFYTDINPNLTAGANNQVVSLMRLRDRGRNNTGGFTGTQRLSILMENANGGQFPFQLFSETGSMRIGYSTVATPSAQVEIRGAGSTSATTSLLVRNSSGTDLLKVQDDGNVGIGTSSPLYILDVRKTSGSLDAVFTNTDSTSGITFYQDNNQGRGLRLQTYGSTATGTLLDGTINRANSVVFRTNDNSYPMVFGGFSNSSEKIYFGKTNFTLALNTTTNNVTIGASSGTARLQVKGSGSTFATTSLLVQNSSGADLFKVRDDAQIFCAGSISLAGISATSYGIFGSQSYDPAVVLGAQSTTAGFLPPRMTTTQKLAIATPPAGLMVYDNTLNQMSYYNGATWINF